MPGAEVGERVGERGGGEGRGGPQDDRDVVGGAGAFEGVDEPEPALRAGEREALGPVVARGAGLPAVISGSLTVNSAPPSAP
ncbi:hypothetical protein, partial [Streptomyces zhihengii]